MTRLPRQYTESFTMVFFGTWILYFCPQTLRYTTGRYTFRRQPELSIWFEVTYNIHIICHVPFLIFIVIRFIIILYCTNGPIKALFKIFGFHWTLRLWARTNHLIIEQMRGSAVARGSHRDEWRSFSKYGALLRAPTHTYFVGFIDLTGKTNGRRLQLSVET